MAASLAEKLAALPAAPGVYLMKDARGKLLYVGKSVALRHRVSSYFDNPHLPPRIAEMVKKVADIDYIVTRTEKEALILEGNLIQMHRPPYNVRLRDDKSFPCLKLTLNERFPALWTVRQAQAADDGATYFGPFANAKAMWETVRLIKRLFGIRTGSIVADRVRTGCPWRDTRQPLDRACLEYHIQCCAGPCINAVDEERYRQIAQDVKLFLDGRSEEVLRRLRAEMEKAAEELRFERAAQLRDQIAAVQSVTEKQHVVSLSHEDQDVIAVAIEAARACVQVLVVRQGKLIGERHFLIQDIVGRNESEILSAFVRQHYDGPVPVPPEVLLAENIEDLQAVTEWLADKRGKSVAVLAPQRGRKRALIEMARQNAMANLKQWLAYKQTEREIAQSVLEDLQQRLHLPTLPRRMECFDISTLQGSFSGGSMVVFENGRPSKKQYRLFNIKWTSQQEPNDFEMMREVLRRRFQRYVAGDEKFSLLPDLLLVDGGKGQLGCALEVLQEFHLNHIPAAGLAKEHELVFLPHQRDPLVIPRNAPALHLLQRIRDEAHRFALTQHRKRRGKATVHSLLDDVPGIGETRKRNLLKHFGSLKRMKAASVDELAAVPEMTRAVAERLQEFLNRQG
ncbi:MAG: excinuclease ABC subunit UvrC [Abditibacteriales bacterium]|nr:excinuclease ABC subunit UvrC [Abditibacteriales bacterium]MDW8367110.1 excinuclease ABC subunit UvrC [Abditibacteriales bacterium]